MAIPKSFRLVNRHWKVRFVKPDAMDGNWGETNWKTHTISLSENLKNEPLETLLHTFEHELMHAFLIARGNIEVHDEEFVEGMAALRRQYEQTSRGEL